jgi:hypothetical protein
LVVCLCAVGCGGGSNSDAEVAKRIAAWSDAAVAYSEIIGNCARQPNPVQGFWDDCTRQYRRNYAAASAAVVRAVCGCSAAKTLPRLVKAETAALAAESKWNQRFLDDIDRNYTGPGLLGLRTRSVAQTRQASRTADRLSRQPRSTRC